MRVFALLLTCALSASTLAAPARAGQAATRPAASTQSPSKEWRDATATAERRDGLLSVYVDAAAGKVMLALPPPDAEGLSGRFIWMSSLSSGVGSAPLGLDRAQPGESRILVFRRLGTKVLFEVENTRFRATGAPAAEQRAAANAFAYSTVWAGKVAASNPDGSVLVDVSDFLTRDVMGVADSLKLGGESGYKLSTDLSAADVSRVKVFPDNIELEGRQTYVADAAGPELRNIAPDPKQISLSVRFSLIRLPAPGFQARRFDPRTGAMSFNTYNYASQLGAPVMEAFSPRFRLEKLDPAAPRSRVKKPIVFYVDRAAPEPIRSALVEGASWWAKAFEDAGYIDAFRVQVLPEGADPQDVRYNVINWVDRATRGWSYGQPVTDPRTGETLKGSVLLGALRVRQDMLIFESLVGADQDGTGGPNDPQRVALARIRQLAAHETGHALGFMHNFAGSTQGRTSVMDYPPPRILLKDGRIDLSDAYAVGIGGWDRFTVDWLYGAVPEGAAGQSVLDAKVAATIRSGLRYVTDQDSRPQGAAQPWGSLWDDGADPAAELRRMLEVRKVAISQFGLGSLHPSEPVADLRRRYVPIYLLHRYQVDAAAKLLGGVDYAYALKGDGREASTPVSAGDQQRALGALLAALDPAVLDTPEPLQRLLSAGSSGETDRQEDIEVFATQGGSVFDPMVAADVGATLVLKNLFAPDRLNRLADQHRRDPHMPGVDQLLTALIASAFAPATDPRRAAIAREVQADLVISLATAAREPRLSASSAASLQACLNALRHRFTRPVRADALEHAHRQRLAALLGDRHELDRALKSRAKLPSIPPGMPIGGGETDWFGDLAPLTR